MAPGVFKAGHKLKPQLADGKMSFFLNEEPLGIAFSDPLLRSEGLVPRIWIGEGAIAKVGQGAV